MAVEEAGMETQATNIDQMILQLNEFITSRLSHGEF